MATTVSQPEPSTGVCVVASSVVAKPAAQRAALRAWLADRGIDRVRWFVGGPVLERGTLDAFRALDHAVCAGVIRTVLLHSMDAFAVLLVRCALDLSRWRANGVQLVLVADALTFTLDGNPQGTLVEKSVHSMRAAVAAKRRNRRVAAGRLRRATLRRKQEAAKEMHGQGAPVEAIATTLAVRVETVHRMLTTPRGQSYLGGRRNTATKADPARVFELVEYLGHSYASAASAVGVSQRTAIRYVQKVCEGNPAPQPAVT